MVKIIKRMSVFAATSLLATQLFASDYPNNTVTIVVPFNPGGSTDIVARYLAEALTEELGQPFVVDNRGGAGGAIGANAIANARPDGYTLGMATVSTMVINPSVRGDELGYDPIESFTHITSIAAVPNVVTVNPNLPVSTMDEFLEYARNNPGKLNFGTPGPGSLGHMMGATTMHQGEIDMVHIPYQGGGPARAGVLAGDVEVFFDNLPSSLPNILAGDLVALAVASEYRVPELPDVPTFAEVGLDMVNDPAWFGLVGPKDLPDNVVNTIYTATINIINSDAFIEKLQSVSASPIGNTPEAFRETIQTANKNTRHVIESAELTFD